MSRAVNARLRFKLTIRLPLNSPPDGGLSRNDSGKHLGQVSLRPLATCLTHPYGGGAYLHRDPSLSRRLCDPLSCGAHPVRPAFCVRPFEELGNPRPRMGADGRLAGAAQLQLEVEPWATS